MEKLTQLTVLHKDGQSTYTIQDERVDGVMEDNQHTKEALNSLYAGAVRHDTAQALTSAQQTQARANMGAASNADLQEVAGILQRLAEDLPKLETTVETLQEHGFVFCGIKQSLTSEQKTQARENIGAASMEQLQAYTEEAILGGAW